MLNQRFTLTTSSHRFFLHVKLVQVAVNDPLDEAGIRTATFALGESQCIHQQKIGRTGSGGGLYALMPSIGPGNIRRLGIHGETSWLRRRACFCIACKNKKSTRWTVLWVFELHASSLMYAVRDIKCGHKVQEDWGWEDLWEENGEGNWLRVRKEDRVDMNCFSRPIAARLRGACLSLYAQLCQKGTRGHYPLSWPDPSLKLL